MINQDDVHACYSTMLSERSSATTPSKLAAKRPPPPTSSGSTGAGSPHESVDAASFAAAADSNKRPRLELPGVVGP